MTKIKSYGYDQLLKKELKNPEFKKEYDKLSEDFALASEVINFRKGLNMTQKELAKIAKTSQPAIARLESGNYKNLSLSFLNKIANALGAKTEIHLTKVV